MAKTLTRISDVAAAIEANQIGVFPHDTVWGLIGKVSEAVTHRIAVAKQRPNDKPFILLIPSMIFVPQYVSSIVSEDIQRFMVDVWPGPVTLILPKQELVPDWLTAQKPTLAMRYPEFDPLADLMDLLKTPILSTSANRSGQPTMTSLADADPVLLAAVDFIYSEDEPLSSEPSTIVDCTGDTPEIIREGINVDQVNSHIENRFG